MNFHIMFTSTTPNVFDVQSCSVKLKHVKLSQNALLLFLCSDLARNRLQTIEGLTFKGLESLVTLKLRRNSISVLSDGAFWGLQSIQNM